MAVFSNYYLVTQVKVGSDWFHQQVMGSQNRFSKCNFQIFCLKLKGPELSYLVYNIIQRSSTKVVQIMPLGPNLTPPQGSQFYIELNKENFKRLLLLSHTYGNLTKFNRNDPWSPTKIVQMVLIGWQKGCPNYAPNIKRGPVWGHI